VKTTLIRFVLGSLVSASLVACGGASKHDSYARGTNLEAQCCENLQGTARDTCLGELPKVADKAVQSDAANQATYRCVAEHFTCDRATGHATQQSAQAQLECIQQL
jgi:hypothetical protein